MSEGTIRRALRIAIGTSLVFGGAACGREILLGDASRSDGNGGDIDGGSPDSGSGPGAGGGPIELNTVAVDSGVTVGSCSFPLDAPNAWLLFDSDAVEYNRDLYAMRADGSVLLRLTTDLSNEQNPTVSPNGRSLAFVSDRTGSNQIYIEDLATGGLVQLTTIPAGADQPSWSPDSSRIAFHSGASVWIMAADGSGQRVVATGLDDGINPAEYPSVSLDGTQVVFEGPGGIGVARLDKTGTRYIVPNVAAIGETPAVSPDGTLVAFAVACDQRSELIAIAPFAGDAGAPCALPQITPPSGHARRPAWGPAGVVAFELTQPIFPGASNPGGGAPASIAAIAPDAGAWCELAGPPADNRNPSWAPAGYRPR
jgi:TolB protein